MTGYSVDTASVLGVVANTQESNAQIPAVQAAVTNALDGATASLPPEFSSAIAALEPLGAEANDAIGLLRDYTDGCVQAVRASMSVYFESDADMVASSARRQDVITDHTAEVDPLGYAPDHETSLGEKERKPGSHAEASGSGSVKPRDVDGTADSSVSGPGKPRDADGTADSSVPGPN